MRDWFETSIMEDDSLEQEILQKEKEAEERDRWKRFKQTVILGLVGLLIIGISLVVFIQYSEKARKENALTMEKAMEYYVEDSTDIQSYEFLFQTHGIEKPKVQFVYNLKLPEDVRSELDPFWQDIYLGFEENRNEVIALYEVADGIILLSYDPNSGEIYSLNSWGKVIDHELSTEVLQTKAEKVQKIKEALESGNRDAFPKYTEEIAAINEHLQHLYDKMLEHEARMFPY